MNGHRIESLLSSWCDRKFLEGQGWDVGKAVARWTHDNDTAVSQRNEWLSSRSKIKELFDKDLDPLVEQQEQLRHEQQVCNLQPTPRSGTLD